MPTPQKEAVVAALRENVERAQSLYLTDFAGVTVHQMEDMRRKLREVEAEYKVIKNTLLKLALADTPYAAMGEGLSGQTGIAIGYGDPAAPARVLHGMIKDLEKNQVKSIAYEQEIHDAEFLKKLASLPSREVQLQILLGTMMAPVSGMARVLNAIREKLEEAGCETVGDLLQDAPAEPAAAESKEVAEEATTSEEATASEEAAPEAEADVEPEKKAEAEAEPTDAEEKSEEADETPEAAEEKDSEDAAESAGSDSEEKK